MVSNVNLPNRGQVPDLPAGAVVETNALFTRNGIDPVSAGPTPAAVLPLVMNHVLNQENTLSAALRCDRKLGFAAFVNDPRFASVSPSDAQELFCDMLENQRDYLPSGWF